MAVTELKSRKAFEKATNSSVLSVVLVGADWCGACQKLKPEYKKLPEQAEGVNFFELNGDKGQGIAIADELNIDALPTVLLYQNGKLLRELRGPKVGDILDRWNTEKDKANEAAEP